ncbi:uncharacterized protein LAJ45_02492 [Morchella importuna]|uniref:uncharacterized protein n=1 Tax=Morchella importuna TaxID=1174673 RepID=UPI001E8E1C32|nr:uncharacterized protein LAJ45_02492 [Morchella importuna]KAH8153679.1 hypothetical protein LAJ45_02492 [Morchella importuna]
MTPSILSSLSNKSNSGHKYAKSSLCLQNTAIPQLPIRLTDLSTFNLHTPNTQLPRRLDLSTFNLRTLNDTYDAENPPESSFDTNALTTYCTEKACGFDYHTYFDQEEGYTRSLEVQNNHESGYCIDSSGPAPINEYGPVSASLMAQSREKSSGLDYYDLVNEEGEETHWLEANDRTNNNYMSCGIAECCGGHDNSLCDSGEEDGHERRPENTIYLSGHGSMSEIDIEQYIDPSSPQYGGDAYDYYGYFDDDELANVCWVEAEGCICGVPGCCGDTLLHVLSPDE